MKFFTNFTLFNFRYLETAVLQVSSSLCFNLSSVFIINKMSGIGKIVAIEFLISAEQLALLIFSIFSGSKLFSFNQLWSFKIDIFNEF